MDALPSLVDAKNAALFEKYEVLSHRELESRHEIFIEQYFYKINIEGETAASIASTMILPAANRYLGELLQTVERAHDVGMKVPGVRKTAERVAGLIDELTTALDHLVAQNAELGGDEIMDKAEHMRHNIIPAMGRVREAADQLEKLIADDLWPMPTYREMLFVK
jgi:glutamine synthetase